MSLILSGDGCATEKRKLLRRRLVMRVTSKWLEALERVRDCSKRFFIANAHILHTHMPYHEPWHIHSYTLLTFLTHAKAISTLKHTCLLFLHIVPGTYIHTYTHSLTHTRLLLASSSQHTWFPSSTCHVSLSLSPSLSRVNTLNLTHNSLYPSLPLSLSLSLNVSRKKVFVACTWSSRRLHGKRFAPYVVVVDDVAKLWRLKTVLTILIIITTIITTIIMIIAYREQK